MKKTSLCRALAIGLAMAALVANVQPATADYADAVLADGPVGYWRFNEPDGDVARNLGTEGDAFDGAYFGGQRVPSNGFTLVDGRQVTGLGDGNLAFQVGEDLDEFMSVEFPILSGLPEFTMTGWVNPGPRDGNRIGLFGQNDAIEFGFINPNTIQLWTPSGQVLNYNIDPENEIPEDTWFHVAAVGTGTELQLYINGENTSGGPTGYGRSSFPFNIGGGGVYDAAGNQFTGSIDEVAVFDFALTDAQLEAHVAAAMAAGGSYSAAVLADKPFGYWGFDESDAAAVNQGTRGASLNGTYNGQIDRNQPGPQEALAGFTADNKAISVEAPEEGFVRVDESILSGLTEFSMSGWVKPGFIEDNRVGLFGQNDAMEFGFINPTTIQMWTPQGGAANFTFIDEIQEDEWVHIAAIGDGEEIRIYVNGELAQVGGTPLAGGQPVDSYGDSDFPFNVGGGGIYDAGGNQFTGLLDEVAVYDKALTANQIRAQFEAALGGPAVPGDYNGNGELDTEDLDLQSAGIKSGDLAFDLTGDGTVDYQDRLSWVKDLKKTWVGDANFDGVFNTTDLITVFQAGKFELDEMAGWTEGDFDGNMRFGTGDLLVAFQDGGFEQGPRGAVSAVPEPGSLLLLAIGLAGLLGGRRRR